MAEENKGPFYSFNPEHQTIVINKVCNECPCLWYAPVGDRDHDGGAIWLGEAKCPHEVCPRLDEVRKGAKNNG